MLGCLTLFELTHYMNLMNYTFNNNSSIFFAVLSGHIPSLVQPDMLDPTLTRLVAVNSIYFKGLWKSRFQAQYTKLRSFTAADGKSYKVPMMSQLSVFNIGKMLSANRQQFSLTQDSCHCLGMCGFVFQTGIL